MTRYYDEEGYELPRPRVSNVYLFLIALLCMIILLGIGLIRFRPDLILPSVTITQPAPAGNVGGQAPAVVRGTNSAPRAQATPIPGIAQSPAEADQLYADAIATAQPAAPAIVPAPLPLNSAGAPIIDARQQEQQQLALELAAQEALQAQRAAQLSDAYSRAPDVSYEDAKALLGRDPCHVPRADPATCSRGLYKPTPVQ